MAELAYAGETGRGFDYSMFFTYAAPHPYPRTIVADGIPYLLDAGIDAVEGNPTPSWEIPSIGESAFYVAVPEGTSTITADVLQASNTSPRPKVTIKANAAIGVAADQETVAGAGAGWTTVTDEVTTTGAGVLDVRVKNQQPNDPAYVDNLGVVGSVSSFAGAGTGKGGTTWLGPPGQPAVVAGGETRIPSIGGRH